MQSNVKLFEGDSAITSIPRNMIDDWDVWKYLNELRGLIMRPPPRKISQLPLHQFVAVVVLFMFVSTGCSSTDTADTDLRPQSASPGVPDVSGTWARQGCVQEDGTVGRCPLGPQVVDPETLPFTLRALAFIEAFDEALNPKYECSPASIPSLFADPYDFRIEPPMADRLIFTYEKDDIVRTIWMEGSPHPEPSVYDLTIQGHSHGRYEGNELVIETGKFAFNPMGLEDNANFPTSTLKRVVERYRREDQRLKLDVIIEDPLIIYEPIEFGVEWEATDNDLTLPYACDLELSQQPRKYMPPGGLNSLRQPITTSLRSNAP